MSETFFSKSERTSIIVWGFDWTQRVSRNPAELGRKVAGKYIEEVMLGNKIEQVVYIITWKGIKGESRIREDAK